MATIDLIEVEASLWYLLTHAKSQVPGTWGIPVPKGANDRLNLVATTEEQLQRVHYELSQGIAQGTIGGIPLNKHFEKTITKLFGFRHNAAQRAVSEFLRSQYCENVDMLGLKKKQSIIGAFSTFLSNLLQDEDALHNLERETLRAFVKTLARYPEPGYIIEDQEIYPLGELGWIGIANSVLTLSDSDSSRWVCFAKNGRYMEGELQNELIAALFEPGLELPSFLTHSDFILVNQARSYFSQMELR